MEKVNLFKSQDGEWVSNTSALEMLRKIGASDCEILVVQTGVEFGVPNLQLPRREYLGRLYEVLAELRVDTLVVPTFTFSFCNNEVFDVRKSKTSMGALAEYIRTRPNARRSLDPLLSMSVIGKQDHILDGDLGDNSLGVGSAYDRLHRTNDVKFLCFGSDFSEYFTYVHYVEKMLDVPYRFDQEFHGTIIDWDGKAYEDTHYIHTACGGVVPSAFPHFKELLVQKGMMQSVRMGDSEAVCIKERDVYSETVRQIRGNIHYFLKKPFVDEDLTKVYQYGRHGERVTHC